MNKKTLSIVALAVAACIVSQPSMAGSSSMNVRVTNVQITPTTGGYVWDYTVFNQSEESSVDRFLVPELNSGDLVGTGLPSTWTASEISSSQATSMGFTLPTIYSGAPVGAYLLLNGNGAVMAPGGFNPGPTSTLDFDFFSTLGGKTNASFDFHSSSAGQQTQLVDPPIPAPEPAEVALFAIGAAGAVALRRRKNAA